MCKVLSTKEDTFEKCDFFFMGKQISDKYNGINYFVNKMELNAPPSLIWKGGAINRIRSRFNFKSPCFYLSQIFF